MHCAEVWVSKEIEYLVKDLSIHVLFELSSSLITTFGRGSIVSLMSANGAPLMPFHLSGDFDVRLVRTTHKQKVLAAFDDTMLP